MPKVWRRIDRHAEPLRVPSREGHVAAGFPCHEAGTGGPVQQAGPGSARRSDGIVSPGPFLSIRRVVFTARAGAKATTSFIVASEVEVTGQSAPSRTRHSGLVRGTATVRVPVRDPLPGRCGALARLAARQDRLRDDRIRLVVGTQQSSARPPCSAASGTGYVAHISGLLGLGAGASVRAVGCRRRCRTLLEMRARAVVTAMSAAHAASVWLTPNPVAIGPSEIWASGMARNDPSAS